MKIALWALFIIIFVWIISVIVAIVSPNTAFGLGLIMFSIIGAIVILTIVEILR